MASTSKAELETQLAKLIELHRAKGPTYPMQALMVSEQGFQQKVGTITAELLAEAGALERVTDANSKARRELLKQGIPVLQWLMPMHETASRRLDKASAAHDVSPASQVVYTPGQKIAGNELADEIIRLRSAGIDVTTDGSDESRQLRDGIRIGTVLQRNNPHEMKGAGAALLLAIHGPEASETGAEADANRAAAAALRAGLAERGVMLGAFVPSIEAAAKRLNAELESGQLTKKSQAKDARDNAQIEVEQINARILVTVNALAGMKVRDSLRELLPKTSQGQRSSDRAEPSPVTPSVAGPGPVAAGTAGGVAPAAASPAPSGSESSRNPVAEA